MKDKLALSRHQLFSTVIHLLLAGILPCETPQPKGLSHCEISWFSPAHTLPCLCYAALHSSVPAWINVGRQRFPTPDKMEVFVTQCSGCSDRESHSFIPTVLPPAEAGMSKGKCGAADEIRTKSGAASSPFLTHFPA